MLRLRLHIFGNGIRPAGTDIKSLVTPLNNRRGANVEERGSGPTGQETDVGSRPILLSSVLRAPLADSTRLTSRLTRWARCHKYSPRTL